MKTQNVVARVNGFTKTSETNPRVSSIVLTAALKLSFFSGNYFMICKKIISAKKLSISISLQISQHCVPFHVIR